MSETALKFLFVNLIASGAILVVICLRRPMRRQFGPALAYGLWLLPPLAAAAGLIPPRLVLLPRPALAPATPLGNIGIAPVAHIELQPSAASQDIALPEVLATSQPIDPWQLAFALWLAGAVAMLIWQWRNQSLFMNDARAGFAGPAVAGFFKPKIITPADFDQRFDDIERQMILAHERIHLTRNDARVNAAVALARCACWFNPLVHLASHLMRIDQELACDAAVVRRHPKARSRYASALFKAQLASRPLPLGCYWPARSQHPLTERIEMLKHTASRPPRRATGAVLLLLLAAGAGVSAWAAMPPETRLASNELQDQPAPPPASSLPAPVWNTSDAMSDIPDGYDPSLPVLVSGKVERIDFSDKTYSLLVRATSLSSDNGWSARADNRLWRLNPTLYWGDKDAINAQLLGKHVSVNGVRARTDACPDATCNMFAKAILTARATVLPSLSSAPAFGVADFALHFDTSRPTLFQGKVKRIAFGDRVFDMFVETKGWGGSPDWIYQVRSEYRHPRAEIEKLLRDTTVSVAGWLPRIAADQVFESPTAVYGTDFQLADGRKVWPAGEQLLTPAMANANASLNIDAPRADPDKLPWIPPGFTLKSETFDMNAPVEIDGKVIRADAEGWWVEVIGFAPASTPGAKAGAVWRVIGGGKDKQGDVGRRMTARGYNAVDKTCQPNCLMDGSFGSFVR